MDVFYKILKWAPGAIMGALVFFAGVGPNEASSHISEWLSLIGVGYVPPWLANKSIDAWGFWIGLVGLTFWAIVKWGIPWMKKYTQSPLLSPSPVQDNLEIEFDAACREEIIDSQMTSPIDITISKMFNSWMRIHNRSQLVDVDNVRVSIDAVQVKPLHSNDLVREPVIKIGELIPFHTSGQRIMRFSPDLREKVPLASYSISRLS